jgi:hypothetical protein
MQAKTLTETPQMALKSPRMMLQSTMAVATREELLGPRLI